MLCLRAPSCSGLGWGSPGTLLLFPVSTQPQSCPNPGRTSKPGPASLWEWQGLCCSLCGSQMGKMLKTWQSLPEKKDRPSCMEQPAATTRAHPVPVAGGRGGCFRPPTRGARAPWEEVPLPMGHPHCRCQPDLWPLGSGVSHSGPSQLVAETPSRHMELPDQQNRTGQDRTEQDTDDFCSVWTPPPGGSFPW